MEHKKISIIIPMRNEEKYIARCIDSILASDYPNDYMEILVINSMSNDTSINIVSQYTNKYNFINLYENKNIYTPYAFNIGIEHSSGEYIFIVSAHSEYDKDYFSVLVRYANELKADAVGAVSKTEVINKTKISKAIKNVLSHRFGVGDSYFRIGSDKIIEVDAISGCYHRSVFDKLGPYNEKLIRNQDIELNKRIKNNGGKLYLIPFTSYTYFARENLRELAKNNFQNGKWNILTAFHTRTLRSLSFRHFIPLVFILSLIIPVCMSLINNKIGLISLISFLSYLLLVIIVSYKLSRKDNNFWETVAVFFTLHFSYGLGSLVGVFKVLIQSFSGKQ